MTVTGRDVAAVGAAYAQGQTPAELAFDHHVGQRPLHARPSSLCRSRWHRAPTPPLSSWAPLIPTEAVLRTQNFTVTYTLEPRTETWDRQHQPAIRLRRGEPRRGLSARRDRRRIGNGPSPPTHLGHRACGDADRYRHGECDHRRHRPRARQLCRDIVAQRIPPPLRIPPASA